MSEILFEFVPCGNVIKVTAVEPETKLEAVVVAPITLDTEQMKQLAMQKLAYLLKKQTES
jgi:hypothetical protein